MSTTINTAPAGPTPEEIEAQNQRDARTLTQMIRESSVQFSFDNITKIINQNQITIGDETYTFAMIKPKQLRQLKKLQNERNSLNDDVDGDRIDEIVKEQAMICLKEMTPEKFENTDMPLLLIVINACVLRANGFRQI